MTFRGADGHRVRIAAPAGCENGRPDTDVARSRLAEARRLAKGLEDDVIADELRRAAELAEDLRRG
jgi:hypothetical protein